MADSDVKKEALFNEVKGSLFEFLVAKKLALLQNQELDFLRSLDRNYLTVLSQQDRMVRQFYPEMIPFLEETTKASVESLQQHLGPSLSAPRLRGKFSNAKDQLDETDITVSVQDQERKISLKLNKKNSFVNTKSGGIKSFFSVYFPFLQSEIQTEFNRFVDLEFHRMGHELHEYQGLTFPGDFGLWVEKGYSELPGELTIECREILHRYYARIAARMSQILKKAFEENSQNFKKSLAPLMGFSDPQITQLICFHDFKQGHDSKVFIHEYSEIEKALESELRIVQEKSSVNIDFGHCDLQIRVKPMNKFTTTAIKINCSVRFRPTSAS